MSMYVPRYSRSSSEPDTHHLKGATLIPPTSRPEPVLYLSFLSHRPRQFPSPRSHTPKQSADPAGRLAITTPAAADRKVVHACMSIWLSVSLSLALPSYLPASDFAISQTKHSLSRVSLKPPPHRILFTQHSAVHILPDQHTRNYSFQHDSLTTIT